MHFSASICLTELVVQAEAGKWPSCCKEGPATILGHDTGLETVSKYTKFHNPI
jgi:hypothetical protein